MSRRPSRTLETDIRDGSEAHRLLTDSAFQMALAQLREDCTERWVTAESVEARETEWCTRRAVDALESELSRLANRVEHAKSRLERGER